MLCAPWVIRIGSGSVAMERPLAGVRERAGVPTAICHKTWTRLEIRRALSIDPKLSGDSRPQRH